MYARVVWVGANAARQQNHKGRQRQQVHREETNQPGHWDGNGAHCTLTARTMRVSVQALCSRVVRCSFDDPSKANVASHSDLVGRAHPDVLTSDPASTLPGANQVYEWASCVGGEIAEQGIRNWSPCACTNGSRTVSIVALLSPFLGVSVIQLCTFTSIRCFFVLYVFERKIDIWSSEDLARASSYTDCALIRVKIKIQQLTLKLHHNLAATQNLRPGMF
jgi:hypothetical protein